MSKASCKNPENQKTYNDWKNQLTFVSNAKKCEKLKICDIRNEYYKTLSFLPKLMDVAPEAFSILEANKLAVNYLIIETTMGLSRNRVKRYIFGKTFPPSLRTLALQTYSHCLGGP